MSRALCLALAAFALLALGAPALAGHDATHPVVKVDFLPRGIAWPSPDHVPIVVYVYNNEARTLWVRVETRPSPELPSGWRALNGNDDFVDLEIPAHAARVTSFTPVPPADLSAVPERALIDVLVRDLNTSEQLDARSIPIERHEQPYGVSIALEREDWTAFHGLSPGERRTFDLRVTNLEDRALDLFFQVWQPESPFFEVAPRTATIQPGSSTVVHVTIAAPERANPGYWAREDLVVFEAMIADRATSAVWIGATEMVSPTPTPMGGLLDAARDHPGAVAAALAAFAALVFALLARAREWLQWLAIAPVLGLFTRIRAPDALDHPLRARLHALITENPGITLAELRSRTSTHLGTLVHHLRALERHGLVTSRRDGAFRRFFAAGAAAEIARVVDGVTPTQREVLRMLEGGPLAQRAIADALGVTRQAANAHVKALERAGRVRIALLDGEWRVALVDEPVAERAASDPRR